MHKITMMIKPLVENCLDIEILGPIPCMISKLKENYRWQIVIKGEFDSYFSKILRKYFMMRTRTYIMIYE